MRFISLFAGVGGFDLALERIGMRCVCQVENNDYAIRVLEKHWPHVPRHKDVRTYHAERGAAELICGGVPCQPASNAGKRRGTADDRWLWPEAIRIVREVKPAWVLFENVCGLLTLEDGVVFESLLSDLEREGYETQAFIIPACAVDAPHLRYRVWIIAHTKGDRRWTFRPESEQSREAGWGCGSDWDVADSEGTDGSRALQIQNRESGVSKIGMSNRGCDWGAAWPEVATRLCGMDDGFPARMDRLKCLGNAVVPQVVEAIGRAIMEAERINNVS